MNRVELEATIALRKKLPRPTVTDLLQEFQDIVLETLRAGREVRIVGFGSFQARHVKPRRGKNPKTGEPVDIPASFKPVFRPSRNLIEALNLPRESRAARNGPRRRPGDLKRALDRLAKKAAKKKTVKKTPRTVVRDAATAASETAPTRKTSRKR